MHMTRVAVLTSALTLAVLAMPLGADAGQSSPNDPTPDFATYAEHAVQAGLDADHRHVIVIAEHIINGTRHTPRRRDSKPRGSYAVRG